jgi:SAM-dependent methyltransferase
VTPTVYDLFEGHLVKRFAGILRPCDYARHLWVIHQAGITPSGSSVLDVGAGPCRYRPFFSHCRYKAQDFCQYKGNRRPTDAASDTWEYGVIDYVCDATSVPVAGGSFDAVLCTEVLEHVMNPESVINEIARLLKPGGRCLITAPLAAGLHQEPFHFYGGFTPFWYHKALTAAGFSQIEVQANGGFFRHYGQESQRFCTFFDPRFNLGWKRWAFLPLWLACLPLLRIALPVLCAWLDGIDKERRFTVGYHVSAVRV